MFCRAEFLFLEMGPGIVELLHCCIAGHENSCGGYTSYSDR